MGDAFRATGEVSAVTVGVEDHALGIVVGTVPAVQTYVVRGREPDVLERETLGLPITVRVFGGVKEKEFVDRWSGLLFAFLFAFRFGLRFALRLGLWWRGFGWVRRSRRCWGNELAFGRSGLLWRCLP